MGFNPNNYEIVKGNDNVLSEELVNIADRYANIAIWISVVSGALMLIFLFFYDLDKKKHAKIVEELKANAINNEEVLDETSEDKNIQADAETSLEQSNSMLDSEELSIQQKNPDDDLKI